ncbi:MAG: metal ABC transporter ATP-binding protein [Candidatus Nanopelagicales bacterium]|jgi:zinc transport system ATP-binding protein|nr:metal ABC transporter ATP-binding protein [Actinomycetota bacterium]MCB0920918.1 metal ABC transporter ATP-binding protein [Actinomycetota bacterium]HNE89316.1 metal ABC transporter ATP-binding protein [Actinomycetota bacterium]HNL51031.1 metal ABC transporter ATP-binding protein [Actinomycetota bacterium]HNO15189.1 metal ABC transporter ATP-binding protein [Actinomycetota bacterium]
MSVVRASGLGVSFGQPVLRDVTLDIGTGEFVALMGANGTGKTTLVRCLLGLLKPDSGQAWLFDTPLPRFRQWPRVAYVPQRLVANSAVPLSVEEAVRSALTSAHHRWRPLNREERNRVRAALEQVGLADRARHRLEDLSGGQQRRVMIARALATRAELLIMDEPTAGIDAGEQTRLAEHMSSLHRQGVTILLITHDLGPVASLAQRAIVLGPPSTRSVRYDGPTPPPPQWTEHVWHHSHDTPEDTGLLEGP